MNHTTDTPRKGDYQCQAGILYGDRCKNDATLETRTGYKCCEHHAPGRDSVTLRDDVKAITLSEKTTQVSDTPRTFVPIDEYLASPEAAERLRAEKAESEVERLREALQLCFWATNTYEGNYTRACDNVATIAIEALKTQDK